MACRNCEYYDPEEYECTLQGGGRDPDGAGTQGCPYWEPTSPKEYFVQRRKQPKKHTRSTEEDSRSIEALNYDASQGDVEAEFELGRRYALGAGVERDFAEAVKWYRRAAEKGHAKAQYNLGSCYQYGLGVETNKDEAQKWHTMGARNGFDPKKNYYAKLSAEQRSCLSVLGKLLLVLSPIPLLISICFGIGPFIATLVILVVILIFLFY